MKNQVTGWLIGGAALLFMTTFFACTKNGVNADQPGPNQNKLSIYLTDDPGYFDKVFVNIQSIAVKIDTAQSWWDQNDNHHHDWWSYWSNLDAHDKDAIWDTLDIHPGIYNLLNLANGADSLLTSSNVAKGRIIAFKLTVGNTGNSVVKDSVSYPVNILPGWNTVYVRVFGNCFQTVSSNHFKMWVDFDAGRSVIKVFNGVFFLRPFLRVFAVSNTGSIGGNIQPFDSYPVVSVENNTDTLYAIPGLFGNYLVMGIPAGTYSVFINASNGYQDTTIQNINVSQGKMTDLGKITLHK